LVIDFRGSGGIMRTEFETGDTDKQRVRVPTKLGDSYSHSSMFGMFKEGSLWR